MKKKTDGIDNSATMKAEIITIGDEILIGQIIDTNSAWIAEQLNLHGIEIYRITSVHDDPEHITEALKSAEEKADLIITTGGLGPTKDDITKEVLCDYFNTKLVFHEPTLEDIKKFIEKRGISLNRLNREQALVPEGCTVLPNLIGTAPGLWFEKDDIIFVALPGVPREMKSIVVNEVLPRLQDNDKVKEIFHKTVLTHGLPESILSERIEEWENSLPGNIKLASLPDPSSVRLRLSTMGSDIDVLKQQVDVEIEKLKEIIPEYIFGYDNETIAEVIGSILVAGGKKLVVAESYTGGYISYLISSDLNSSHYYLGGITASSNEFKRDILEIAPQLLQKEGTESELVVRQMAQNIRKIRDADYAVATLGIEQSTENIVKEEMLTVWIAVAGTDGTVSQKFIAGDDSQRNIIRLSHTALQMLRRMLAN